MFFNLFVRAFLVVLTGGYWVLYVDAAHVSLPKGFRRCKQTDPNFNKCFLEAVQLSVPELSKGQPKFNIPPIDPIRIDSLYIDKGQGSVVAKINFTNLDISGLKTAEIQSAKVDFQKTSIRLAYRTKQPLVMQGIYYIVGKIMVLPINGDGQCKFVMDDFTVSATLKFKSQQKNNEQFWHLEKTDFSFNTTKLHINLSNLFKGNKELGDNMNKFMNENWELLLDELRYAFVDTISSVFSQYVRLFFDRVPIMQVFPSQ